MTQREARAAHGSIESRIPIATALRIALCRLRRRIDESDHSGLETRTTGMGVLENILRKNDALITATDKTFIDEHRRRICFTVTFSKPVPVDQNESLPQKSDLISQYLLASSFRILTL